MWPHQSTDKCSTQAITLFERVNKARSSSNLGTLISSTTLQAFAKAHAESLANEQKLRPSTTNLSIPYGENLHRCRPKHPSVDAFNAWCMKACASTNLYSPLAKFAGVGIVEAQGYANVVMMFTEHDPGDGDGSELGSAGSCTSVGAVLLSDQDVVTRTERLEPKEDFGKEDSGLEIYGQENQDPVGKKLIPEMKALDIAQDAFNHMNGARKDTGVQYLRWDDGLYKLALAHTQRVFRIGRLVHSGKRRFENVAVIDMGSSDKAGMRLLEKLSHRRENVLSSSFEYCAIAFVGDENKAYATQLFSTERVE